MIDLLVSPCKQLLTLASSQPGPRRGPAMKSLLEIDQGALGVDTATGLIEFAGPAEELPAELVSADCRQIEAAQSTVMPGFVDSHTHLVFAGSRADEFYRRAQGESYQDIARSGGGIALTMAATRSASEDELYELAWQRLNRLYANGTTTVETKSGYGLSAEAELSSMRVQNRLKRDAPGLVYSTYLGAHLIPPEFKDDRNAYLELVSQQLCSLAADSLADFYDIFVDPLAFSQTEAQEIVNAGRDCGLPLKLHADEFGDDGTAAWGVAQEAVSVDHLGGIGDPGIAALADSNTIATLLPATMFFSGHGKFAPARRLIDAGCAVALATDLNPGSSLVYSMPFVITLAVLEMGMSAEECINASTINGAFALKAGDKVGSLEPGKRADFLILATDEYRDLACHVGTNLVRQVYIAGQEYSEI